MALSINGTSGISGVDGSTSAPAFQGTDSNTGISFASDTVNINTGGILRAKLDSSGNFSVPVGKLGVGTDSPDYAIEVEGNGGGDTVSLALSNLGNHPAALHLRSGHGNWSIINSATVGDALQIRDESANTTRFHIDSIGRTSIGSSGFGERLRVDASANTMVPMAVNDSSNTATATHRISFRTGGAEKGSIKATNSNTSFNTSSDYRLKENETLISDGITRLKTLKPYRFNWKVNPSVFVDGFFAHEVTAVPEAIDGVKDATQEVDIVYEEGETLPEGKLVGDLKERVTQPVYQSIDHSKLVPLLTAALQEAVGKIETLETKVAALEAA